jgi:hypothetical protein
MLPTIRGASVLAIGTLTVLPGISAVEVQATSRTANVTVRNETGVPLQQVSVAHKFSSDAGQVGFWTNVAPGATPSAFQVSYRTGIGTAGKDWWIISWQYQGQNILNVTEPNNLLPVLESLQNILAIPGALTIGAILGVVSENPFAGQAAAAVAYGFLRNTNSNAGWKQHILRSDDEGPTTTIIIKQSTVIFDSPSGQSSTEGIKTISQ